MDLQDLLRLKRRRDATNGPSATAVFAESFRVDGGSPTPGIKLSACGQKAEKVEGDNGRDNGLRRVVSIRVVDISILPAETTLGEWEGSNAENRTGKMD